MADLKHERAGHGHAHHPTQPYLDLTHRSETEEQDDFSVYLTILDFLIYKAMGLVLEWSCSSDPYNSDLPNALVSMTADWRIFLANKHHGRRLSPTAAFRSRLLHFTLLFTHRLHHAETWTTPSSLAASHEQNKARDEFWTTHTSHVPALSSHPSIFTKDFPLSDAALHTNRRTLADHLATPPDQRRWIDVMAGTTSLYCLLPLLLELTAARADLDNNWSPSSDWFDLIGQFLLQAVIEQYLCSGAHDTSIFNAIFAIGSPGTQRWADEPSSITTLRNLFRHPADPTLHHPSWPQLRTRYINDLLLCSPGESPLQALHRAHLTYSYRAFQRRLLSFLQSLHDSLVKPDLVQVEDGGRINIDGDELSERESKEMFRRMGL